MASRTASPTRVLFLEVDAGDKVLIQDWAARGVLPTFRRLLRDGLVGDTMAPEGFYVGSIWPSLYTGTSPARHGFHSLKQLRPGSYEFYPALPHRDVLRDPFWAHLSRAGRRVAVLDIPLSSITPDLDGMQTVEWGSHDAAYGFQTWPRELAGEIEARFGRHPLEGSCNADNRTPEQFAALRDVLVEGVRRKAELTKHYLSRGGWDFFAQVFTESHCVGHQCWHLHDAAHPGHDRRAVAIAGDPMRDVYQAIDTAIGEILELVGQDTVVVVLAGHRMAHKCGAQFLLPEILVRLGVAKRRAPSAIERLDAALTWSWRRTPAALRRSLQPVRRGVRGWIDDPETFPPPELDMPNSACFLVDNGFPISGLRINLAGREPRGMVEPGAAFEAFCARLSEDLRAIIDLDTGRPAVRRVLRTSELYQGEHIDRLPDVVVDWSDDKPLGSAAAGNPGGSTVRLRSDKIGLVEGVNRYCRTGDHRPQGLFMALGPRLAPGRLEGTVASMDFAPTFCALLGVALPDVDGRPIDAVVAGAHYAAR